MQLIDIIAISIEITIVFGSHMPTEFAIYIAIDIAIFSHVVIDIAIETTDIIATATIININNAISMDVATSLLIIFISLHCCCYKYWY